MKTIRHVNNEDQTKVILKREHYKKMAESLLRLKKLRQLKLKFGKVEAVEGLKFVLARSSRLRCLEHLGIGLTAPGANGASQLTEITTRHWMRNLKNLRELNLNLIIVPKFLDAVIKGIRCLRQLRKVAIDFTGTKDSSEVENVKLKEALHRLPYLNSLNLNISSNSKLVDYCMDFLKSSVKPLAQKL